MKEAISALFPPGVPALVRWRLAVFAVLVVMIGHVIWACGWLDRFGVGGGFAYAADMIRVSDDVSSIKVELIEQKLFDTRVRQCSAQSREPRIFYSEKLQELMRRYRELTESDYNPPQCTEL